MPERKQGGAAGFGWDFLFYWLMATTFGWVLGWLLLPTLAAAMAGVGAGAAQAAVLYRRLPRPWAWALATAVGWPAGIGLAALAVPAGFPQISGAVVGVFAGMAQWAVLQPRLRWTGWWIAVSAVAWSMAFTLAPRGETVALPPLVLSGVAAALATGIALDLLRRNPRPRP